MPEHIEPGIFNPTVNGVDLAHDFRLNLSCQFFSLTGVVVDLKTVRITLPCVIVVNADKNGIALAVSHTDTSGK